MTQLPMITRGQAAVNDRLLARLDMLVETLCARVQARREGSTVFFGTKNPAELCLEGLARGTWYDPASGESGGLLGLISRVYGCNQGEAFLFALIFLGPTEVAALKPPAPQQLGCGGEA